MRTAAPDVAVVVLTGLDSDEVGRQAVELGAQDYLVKGHHGADALARSVVFALERAKRQAAEQRSARVADQLQLVLEASAEGICLLDADGRLEFANPAAALLLGVPPDLLTGRTLHDFHRCTGPGCRLSEQLLTRDEVDAGEQGFRSESGAELVLVLRTRWGKVVEQHDYYADTAAIVALDRKLEELGVEAVAR